MLCFNNSHTDFRRSATGLFTFSNNPLFYSGMMNSVRFCGLIVDSIFYSNTLQTVYWLRFVIVIFSRSSFECFVFKVRAIVIYRRGFVFCGVYLRGKSRGRTVNLRVGRKNVFFDHQKRSKLPRGCGHITTTCSPYSFFRIAHNNNNNKTWFMLDFIVVPKPRARAWAFYCKFGGNELDFRKKGTCTRVSVTTNPRHCCWGSSKIAGPWAACTWWSANRGGGTSYACSFYKNNNNYY